MNIVTILGSGTSTGVPILGCKCDVCNSTNSANSRLRTSVFLTTTLGKNILVDTTPDLRFQLLRHKPERIDAVIMTHDHADHTHGIDDLRPFSFYQKQDLPLYCSPLTAQSLRRKFDYIFERKLPPIGGGIPQLCLHEIRSSEFKIESEEFEFFQLPHGRLTTTGFRHKGLAYLIDCHDVPDEICRHLKGLQLDLLIIDCVKPGSHDTHLGYDKTIEIIKKIQPLKAGLIHMGHEWDHEDLAHRLQRDGLFEAVPLKDGDILQYR